MIETQPTERLMQIPGRFNPGFPLQTSQIESVPINFENTENVEALAQRNGERYIPMVEVISHPEN